MRKLRVLVLMHKDLVPPDSADGMIGEQAVPWQTEHDVVTALQDLGHIVQPLGVDDDLTVIRQAIREQQPHLAFNLLEQFGGTEIYVPFILGYLELTKLPYTGCNARGLLLARDKALMRKILKHHRIPMPDFFSVRRGRTAQRPKRLSFPLIVKSATLHGSVGIAQASVVHDDERLKDRVEYVHEGLGSEAIAEEYIEGQELYVGLIDNNGRSIVAALQ